MAQRIPPFPLLDDRLARLGHDWFADVRRNQPVEPAPTSRAGRAPGDVVDGAWDWLFGGSDESCGDDGGRAGGCAGDCRPGQGGRRMAELGR